MRVGARCGGCWFQWGFEGRFERLGESMVCGGEAAAFEGWSGGHCWPRGKLVASRASEAPDCCGWWHCWRVAWIAEWYRFFDSSRGSDVVFHSSKILGTTPY